MIIKEEKEKIRSIKLSESEVNIIIDALEDEPYRIYKFFSYNKIVKKLREKFVEPKGARR